jgi:hypothetical protein
MSLASVISNESRYSEQEAAQYERYRSLCVSSVVSLILAIIGLPAIFMSGLLFIPAAGAICSVLSLRKIRAAADELSGRGIAISGLVLSACTLIAGSSIAAVIYSTEVPEGYRRLLFTELKPRGDESQLQIPSAILALDGKQVFVKGYVLSDDRRSDLREFILVPDMGTCCFGGNPKLTDMIKITMEDPLRVRYSWQRRKLAGTLHIDPRPKRENGADGPHYHLKANFVR